MVTITKPNHMARGSKRAQIRSHQRVQDNSPIVTEGKFPPGSAVQMIDATDYAIYGSIGSNYKTMIFISF